MIRYRLRTLLIVLALAPPALAGVWCNWEILSEVVPVLLQFLACVAFLVAVAVSCAMGLASLVDAALNPWERRRP
jgi:hypothetical protein